MLLIMKNPLLDLSKYRYVNANLWELQSEVLKNISGRTAPVYCNEENPDEHYFKSSLINYFSHSQYYGMIRVPDSGSLPKGAF